MLNSLGFKNEYQTHEVSVQKTAFFNLAESQVDLIPKTETRFRNLNAVTRYGNLKLCASHGKQIFFCYKNT